MMLQRRIGIFIDGTFFLKASDYFKRQHPIRAALTPVGVVEYCQKIVAEYENRSESEYELNQLWWFQGKMDNETPTRLKVEQKKLRDEYLEVQNELELLLTIGSIQWQPTPAFITPNNEIISPTTKVALAIKAFELAMYDEIDVVVLVTNSYEIIPMVERLRARKIPVVQVSFVLGRDVRPGNGLGRVSDHAAYINSGTIVDSTISQNKNIQRLFDITLYPKRQWGEQDDKASSPFPKTVIRPSKLNDEIEEDPF